VKLSAGPKCELVSRKTAALELPAGTQIPFFYANAADKGYYRVAYTPRQLQAITSNVETGLTVPERIGFLGDRWAQTRLGDAKVGDYLDLALAVRNDPNANVLDSTLASIAAIRNRLADDEDREKLNAVMLKNYGPVYAALGKDSKHESLDRGEIRTELFGALGDAGDPAVLAHAQTLADSLFAGKKPDEPNTVDVAVSLAAANGDEAFYDKLQIVSQKANDPSLASEALVLLTRFRKPIFVVKTLEYATSGKVRNQDSWILIARELSQRETQDLAWAWIVNNWDKVKAQITTASGARIVGAAGAFCTVEKRKEVGSFFRSHKVDASERTLSQALDNIDACVKFRATQEPNLKAWLATQTQ
jgi:aminopeptidase N/puromycin-sensitive aminopeptidase